MDEFEKISRISEGTYGVVYKVRWLWALVVVSVSAFELCDGDEYWKWAKGARMRLHQPRLGQQQQALAEPKAGMPYIGMAWCVQWGLIRLSFLCRVGWKPDRLGAS